MTERSCGKRWRVTAVAVSIGVLGLWLLAPGPVVGSAVARVPRSRHAPASAQAAIVRRVVDGDTIDVRIGGAVRRIRLLQVDTPEVYGTAECFGRRASAALERLLPLGTAVTLIADPGLDGTDRYGRLLRYVLRGTTNLNLWMVANGFAAPYFYRGARGRFAAALMDAARGAIRARRGLWGACPAASFDPSRALDPGPAGQSGGPIAPGQADAARRETGGIGTAERGLPLEFSDRAPRWSTRGPRCPRWC
jgi:endonuclease YncB( thermonuclease family)